MWLGHHLQGQKVKGEGHQAALLSVSLTRKAAAAVSVGTYSAWQSTATLRLLGGARGAWAPIGEERGGGILCRHAHSLFLHARNMLFPFPVGLDWSHSHSHKEQSYSNSNSHGIPFRLHAVQACSLSLAVWCAVGLVDVRLSVWVYECMRSWRQVLM